MTKKKNELTFKKDDKLERIEFAKRLETVIFKLSKFYDDSFVLGLNARYGEGKSTFIEMWKNRLDNRDDCKTVLINAWESDFGEDPLLHIIDGLCEITKKDKNQQRNELKKIYYEMKAAALENSDIENFFSMLAAARQVDHSQDEITRLLKKRGDELYTRHNFKKDSYKDLTTVLSQLIAKEDKKIIIFIDELDRVRPNYAVEFLEAIKHFFCVKGIIFVIAVHRGQLENSIRQIYGNIDFDDYYLRFITREAKLPEPRNYNVKKYIEHLRKCFFEEKNNGGVILPKQHVENPDYCKLLANLVHDFNLTARQLRHLFRMLTQYLACNDSDKMPAEAEIRCATILIGVYCVDKKIYHQLGDSYSVTITDIEKFYQKQINRRDIPLVDKFDYKNNIYLNLLVWSSYVENWNSMFSTFTQFFNRDKDDGEYEEQSEQHKAYDRQVIAEIAGKRSFEALRNRKISLFKETYDRLEEWRPFIESEKN